MSVFRVKYGENAPPPRHPSVTFINYVHGFYPAYVRVKLG